MTVAAEALRWPSRKTVDVVKTTQVWSALQAPSWLSRRSARRGSWTHRASDENVAIVQRSARRVARAHTPQAWAIS